MATRNSSLIRAMDNADLTSEELADKLAEHDRKQFPCPGSPINKLERTAETINNWRNGKCNPASRQLQRRVASILNVNVNTLWPLDQNRLMQVATGTEVQAR